MLAKVRGVYSTLDKKMCRPLSVCYWRRETMHHSRPSRISVALCSWHISTLHFITHMNYIIGVAPSGEFQRLEAVLPICEVSIFLKFVYSTENLQQSCTLAITVRFLLKGGGKTRERDPKHCICFAKAVRFYECDRYLKTCGRVYTLGPMFGMTQSSILERLHSSITVLENVVTDKNRRLFATI